MNEEEIMEDSFQEEESTETPSTSSTGLTYEDIYNATYNAYIDAYTEIKIREAEEEAEQLEDDLENDLEEEETTEAPIMDVRVTNFPTTQGVRVKNFSDNNLASVTDAITNATGEEGVVEFASSTDATLYTVATQGAVSSADAQSVAIMLEIRNIILLFMLVWLVIFLVKMIKNTAMKFTKGKGDSI